MNIRFNKEIRNKALKIIDNQKQNPCYDYALNEQVEIDRLVYEAYGLNEEDIAEVENWYARRYPKLGDEALFYHGLSGKQIYRYMELCT